MFAKEHVSEIIRVFVRLRVGQCFVRAGARCIVRGCVLEC